MYSKPKSLREEAFRIPDNYSGNAFTGDSTVPMPPIEPAISLPQEAEAPIKEEREPSTAVIPASIRENECTHGRSSHLSALLPPKLSSTRGGLLGDIGVEELLIIGILVLLSQSDADDDILLLLMLLLFYK